MDGYIYVLSNRLFKKNLHKIGKTASHPRGARTKELYSTGVPEEFSLVYTAFVKNHDEVEREVHKKLRDKRTNNNREFFLVSAAEAIDAIRAVAEIIREENFFKSEQEIKKFKEERERIHAEQERERYLSQIKDENLRKRANQIEQEKLKIITELRSEEKNKKTLSDKFFESVGNFLIIIFAIIIAAGTAPIGLFVVPFFLFYLHRHFNAQEEERLNKIAADEAEITQTRKEAAQQRKALGSSSGLIKPSVKTDIHPATSHERKEAIDQLQSLDPAFIGYAGSENLIQKANLGDAQAQYALAKLYFSGCDVFAPDFELAKRYFYLAAKSGHKISKIIVAELENGRFIYNKKNQKFAFQNATKINDIQSLSIKSQEKDLDSIGNKKIESKLIEIIKKKMLDSQSIVKTTWLRNEDALVNIETSESFNIVRHRTLIKEQVEEDIHGYKFSPSTGYSYVTSADVWNVWSSDSSPLNIKELSDSSRITKDWAKFGDALIHIPTCKEFKIFRNCKVPLRSTVNEDEHGFLFNPNDRHFFVKREDVHLIICSFEP